MQYDAQSNSDFKWNSADDRLIFGEADPRLVDRFRKFHEANPFVYFKFFEKTNQIMNRGRKKYSAWTILSVIRWETDLNVATDDFVINNDFIAMYARLLMFQHPIFEKFFEKRSMKPIRVEMGEEQRDRILDHSRRHSAEAYE